MPELTRVIVFYDGRVVMERDLWSALNKMFGTEEVGTPTPETGDEQKEPEGIGALAQKANELYRKAEQALKAGDWAGYGKAIEELGQVLEEMVKKE